VTQVYATVMTTTKAEAGAMIARPDPGGMVTVPARPYVVIPAAVPVPGTVPAETTPQARQVLRGPYGRARNGRKARTRHTPGSALSCG
jgi:hypothetical protein